DEVAAFGPTVAVRVPQHPIALALLEATGLPIAAPSANRSTAISPTTADHVEKSLGGRIDLILDGGATRYRVQSALGGVSHTPAVLLRHGALALPEIAAHLPVVDQGAGVVAEGEVAAAPGRFPRHYAPRAKVLLLPEAEALAAARASHALGTKVGLICRG